MEAWSLEKDSKNKKKKNKQRNERRRRNRCFHENKGVELVKPGDTGGGALEANTTEESSDLVDSKTADKVAFKQRYDDGPYRIFWQCIAETVEQKDTFFPEEVLATIRARVSSVLALRRNRMTITNILRSKLLWMNSLKKVFREIDYVVDRNEERRADDPGLEKGTPIISANYVAHDEYVF